MYAPHHHNEPSAKLASILAAVGVLGVLVTAMWPTSPAPRQAHAGATPAVAAPRSAAAPIVQSIARVSPSSVLAPDAEPSSDAADELAEAVAEFELLAPEGPHEQLISENIRDLHAKAADARRDGDEAYAARLELRVSALTERLARVQIERSGELP
jgi:hypothetical protein